MATMQAHLTVVTPADEAQGPAQGAWTYSHYAALPADGRRYEIIEGVLYMAPAPGEAHQSASIRLASYLLTHVEFAGLGRVYPAPFDVELAANVVVQPDVVVVLHANGGIITPSHIRGAPDLVIEITSPSTATHDRSRKLRAYARAGVMEYWLVDPHAQTVEVLTLADSEYRSQGVFQGSATLPSAVVPNLPIRVEQFFG